MLKLYHTPISPNSRRVWIALLEKGLSFELVNLNLDGDQMTPEFLALNPFHHIPVLVDDGFRVIESLAILDYLETKYPQPSLLPQEPQAQALVNMVNLVTVNELMPAMGPLLRPLLGMPAAEPEQVSQAKEKLTTVLTFLEELLGDRPYFGSDSLTLAEIVAGCLIPWLPVGVDMPLDNFPKLRAWSDNLTQRAAWITTQPTEADLEAFRARMQARMAQ